MTADQEPRAGEVLTAESVKLLRAGDVLRLDGRDVRFRNLFMGGVRADDGSDKRISALPHHRFTFLARPGVEYPHDGGDMPEFLRGRVLSVCFADGSDGFWTGDEWDWSTIKSWSIPAPEAAKADDWIEWTGGENPVPGAMVDAALGTATFRNCSSDFVGSYWADPGRYRVASPAPEAAREEGWTGRKCPTCKGSGQTNTDPIGPCVDCGGTGDEWAALRPQAPATAPSDVDGATVDPLTSIAESLKRIADTLDGTAAGVCVSETVFGGARHG